MLLTSFWFPLFVAAVCILYYAMPKKWRWCVLLAASYGFYCTFSVPLTGFLVFNTVSIFLCARKMDSLEKKGAAQLAALPQKPSREEKKAFYKRLNAKKRAFLLLGLFCSLGVLIFMKYSNFLAGIFTGEPLTFAWIVLPIGLSFYTFQSVGYLIDVYSAKCEADKNIFRYALFVSFFPQIIQGPIGRYSALSKTLFAENTFHFERFRHGILTILWGYFKKLIIADRLAALGAFLSAGAGELAGMEVLIVALAYTFQLYCDFSGGIDIVRGVAQLFGVSLAKNFERPFFATSVTEFWRRWHISLGAWVREYVFYPLSLSGAWAKLTKKTIKALGKTYGKIVPLCLSTIVLFLVIGIWHGASWNYVFYGFANGGIVCFGLLCEPLFFKWKKAWHVRENALWFRVLQMLRTFILLCLVRIVTVSPTLSAGLGHLKNLFSGWSLSSFSPRSILSTLKDTFSFDIFDFLNLAIAIAGLLVVFVVSLLQENKKSVSGIYCRCPALVRWLVLLVVVSGLIFLAASGTSLTGGFLYARF